eukprot:EG_transcript_35154
MGPLGRLNVWIQRTLLPAWPSNVHAPPPVKYDNTKGTPATRRTAAEDFRNKQKAVYQIAASIPILVVCFPVLWFRFYGSDDDRLRYLMAQDVRLMKRFQQAEAEGLRIRFRQQQEEAARAADTA